MLILKREKLSNLFISRGISAKGLVLYLGNFQFFEARGKLIRDKSRCKNDGTIYGAKWVQGKFGKVLSFDGADDYVDCGNNESLDITNAITIEARIKPEKVSEARIVRKSPASSSTKSYMLLLDSVNRLWFFIYDNTATGYHEVKSTTALEIGRWYHIVGTFDGRYMKVYVNGVLEKTIDIGEIATIESNTDPVTIGGTYRKFNGLIDEVRIYNRALSGKEIKQNMYSSWIYKMLRGVSQT